MACRAMNALALTLSLMVLPGAASAAPDEEAERQHHEHIRQPDAIAECPLKYEVAPDAQDDVGDRQQELRPEQDDLGLLVVPCHLRGPAEQVAHHERRQGPEKDSG
mgnify:CR=1 FL=1